MDLSPVHIGLLWFLFFFLELSIHFWHNFISVTAFEDLTYLSHCNEKSRRNYSRPSYPILRSLLSNLSGNSTGKIPESASLCWSNGQEVGREPGDLSKTHLSRATIRERYPPFFCLPYSQILKENSPGGCIHLNQLHLERYHTNSWEQSF